jgi:hypothetical protein
VCLNIIKLDNRRKTNGKGGCVYYVTLTFTGLPFFFLVERNVVKGIFPCLLQEVEIPSLTEDKQRKLASSPILVGLNYTDVN